MPFNPGSYTIGTYTQQPDEDNQYLAAIDISFPASCAPPRSAVARLLISPANPSAPTPSEKAAYSVVVDQTAGALTKRMDFPQDFEGFAAMSRVPPLNPTPRTFVVKLEGASCAGVTVTNSLVDVIGTK